MIAYLLIGLFGFTALIVTASLADSIMRAYKAYPGLRQEMADMRSTVPSCNVVQMRPRLTQPRAIPMGFAPRLPRAA